MANFDIPTFTLSAALTVFIVCFVSPSFVAVKPEEKMNAKIDICIILTPVHTMDKIEKQPLIDGVNAFIEHFELGEGMVKIALVTPVLRDEDKGKQETDWLVSPLTESEITLKSKMDEWNNYEIPPSDVWNGFDHAFLTIRDKVFNNSNDRAKAVLFPIPWLDALFVTDDKKKAAVIDVAKILRDRGVWIYVMAERYDETIALDLTTQEKRIIYPESSPENFKDFLEKDTPKLKDDIFIDLCQWKQHCEGDEKKEEFRQPYVNNAKNLCKQRKPQPFNNCTMPDRVFFVQVALGLAVGNLVFQLLIGVVVFVCVN